MNTVMTVTKPEDIKFTLEVTMTLREWLDLQKQLADEWPAHRLSMAITEMSLQARKTFWPKMTDEDAA